MGTLIAVAILAQVATPAHAEVIEPNGVPVPLNSNNGETQLSTLFTQRTESIDFIVDGSATPDTFSPLCGFATTLVLKESGSSLGVGWYNADPAHTAPPTAAEIFEIVPAGSPVGTVINGADIRANANYAGGAIGFALINTPPSYSEARYNTVCTACSTPGPWVLSVSYRSKLKPSAYYVAFEDGATTAFGWSNDGDFNDYVFFFEGLACVGEGEACEVPGAKGVCAPGIEQCADGATLSCTSSIQPSDEVCDGLDNDCDGATDESGDAGVALCSGGKVCSRGQCVPRCGDGEFGCAITPFTQCEDGLCVDPACAGKTCDVGKACIAGECRAPCDDVSCPGTQVCRLGTCVDPCMGIDCEDGRVCVNGACVLRCDCAGCDSGKSCDAASGRCVDTGCETMTCDAGKVCRAAMCVDACDGASCPRGSACMHGTCNVVLSMDGGVPAADGGSAGGASGTSGAAAGTDAGAAGAAGTTDTSGSGPRRDSTASSCGCQVAGGQSEAPLLTTLLFLVACALRSTRRKHRDARRHSNTRT